MTLQEAFYEVYLKPLEGVEIPPAEPEPGKDHVCESEYTMSQHYGRWMFEGIRQHRVCKHCGAGMEEYC